MTSPQDPITDRSYGIIALRFIPELESKEKPKPTTKNTQLFLIHQKTRLGPGTEFWCLPKGHPEAEDADEIETAIREFGEEVGVRVERGDVVSLLG